MTRENATAISTAFEALGWNHQVSIGASGHTITLQVNQMAGDDVLRLFNVLAPNGVPIPGVTVTLNVGAGIVLT